MGNLFKQHCRNQCNVQTGSRSSKTHEDRRLYRATNVEDERSHVVLTSRAWQLDDRADAIQGVDDHKSSCTKGSAGYWQGRVGYLSTPVGFDVR
jgi:hypothetical protein